MNRFIDLGTQDVSDNRSRLENSELTATTCPTVIRCSTGFGMWYSAAGLPVCFHIGEGVDIERHRGGIGATVLS